MARQTKTRCPAYGHGMYSPNGWEFHVTWCKYAQKKAAARAQEPAGTRSIDRVAARAKPVVAVDPALVATIVAQVLKSLAS